MDPLNHLKTKYRQRYFNREGRRQAFDKQGENVLQYIQGCFDTCAKEFKVYSPTISCSSSSSDRDQDQVPSHIKDKEQPQHNNNKNVKDGKSVFNIFTFLPSLNIQDTHSVVNVSEDIETSSKSHISSLHEDIDMISLGSPALLMEEKSCDGTVHSKDEAFEMDLQNSRDVGNSESYHSRKAVKGLSVEKAKCSAASSNGKEISESLASLEAVTCSFTQRNIANVEPEDECEFLIEESFGIPSSSSWISSLGKNPKPQRKSSINVPSQSKKGIQQHGVKRGGKRASQKLVTPNPAKQTEMKSTNIAGQTLDGLQNVSRTNENMPAVGAKSLVISNSTQERRQQRHSKDNTSVEINDRNAKVGSLTKDRASLLKQNQNILQPVLNVEQCSSIRKKNVEETNISGELENKESQEYGTVFLISEDSQESQDSNVHSEDTISTMKPICSVGPVAQPSAPTPNKSFKRQNCQSIASSKKTLQTHRSNVKTTRKRNKILASEESEHKEQQKEVDENGQSNEKQSINHSGKMSCQKGQTFLVTTDSNVCGTLSSQENPSEKSWTEGRLNASVNRQNCNKQSLRYFCAPDVNMNNVSGPVGSTKLTSEHDVEDSNSDEAGNMEEDSDGLVSSSLKHKLVLPTNTPNVRRTKRMRIKPLEYWRGERVNYKTRPSGGFVIGGIISPEQNEPRKPKLKKTKKPAEEQENIRNNSVVSLKDPSQPAVVFDMASNQEVLLECVSSGSSHMFFTSNETVSIYKYLTTPSFSAGKMTLKPLKEKGYQYSHTDTLIFHITQGKLLLTLYDQCYSLTVGDYFFIPPGNVYNIRNVLNKECVILFTQLKGNRPQN